MTCWLARCAAFFKTSRSKILPMLDCMENRLQYKQPELVRPRTSKSLQCHELTSTHRALHEERGNAFYPRLAIAASPPADGKHPRKNWPRQTSFSRSMDHASLRFHHHKKSPGLHRIPPVQEIFVWLTPRTGRIVIFHKLIYDGD